MKKAIKQWLMPLILIFIIPHIINIGACYMMNDKQIKDIPMAVYMGDQTALTRQIVQSFEDTETFRIVKYADSADEVEASMAVGESVYGLVIPEDFTKDLKKYKSPTILTLIDGTQLSSAAFTRIQGTEILLTTKIGGMINVFQAKFDLATEDALHTAAPISITTRLLGNPTRNYINFLLPGMMASLIQIGLAMSTASIVTVGEHRGLDFEKCYFKQMLLYAMAGTLSILLMVLVQTTFFEVPFRGNILGLILLTFAFCNAVVALSMFLSTIIKNKVFATQVVAVFFIPSSIIGGYTWPLVAMPLPIQKLATIMPFTYYGDFLRSWLLEGNYTQYNHSLVTFVLMIAIGAVTSLMMNRLLSSKVVKEAIVLEN
ncbi:MAG: ABC transporter permease [Clostridia bacterium]|nr:ABC transporter permease [Clostridia bacterium]